MSRRRQKISKGKLQPYRVLLTSQDTLGFTQDYKDYKDCTLGYLLKARPVSGAA